MPSEHAPQFLHTSTFTSVARVAAISDEDRFVAKASLAPLRGLLPPDVDPAQDPDLLYISSNGAVGGLINANGDGITAETAVRIHRSARYKFIDVDHDRDRIAGVVLFPALTTLGEHRVVDESEALTLSEPFNMSFAGVLWKAVQPLLTKYITKVGDALDSSALSMSWEVGFNSYSIAVGSRNLFDARIVSPDSPEFSALDRCLRCKGGKGKSPDGQEVYRVIDGEAIVLGYSVVPNPAASVKGILPILPEDALVKENIEPAGEALPASIQPDESAQRKSLMGDLVALVQLARMEGVEPALSAVPALAASVPAGEPIAQATSPENTSEKDLSANKSKTRVTIYTAPMKIESIAQLTSQWDELRKMESAASVESFVSALQAANDKFAADVAAQESVISTLKETQAATEQAKAAAEQKVQELENSLAEVQKQIEALKSAALASEQNAKFVERMAALDEAFTLDDEDRELLAADVRSCADDAAFAAFMKKQEKLLAAKKKSGKAKDAKCDDEEMEDEDMEGEAKKKKCAASVDTSVVVAALASVTPAKDESSIPAGSITVDTNLADEMQAAFGSTFKIDGKSVTERKATKAAKAPKE